MDDKRRADRKSYREAQKKRKALRKKELKERLARDERMTFEHGYRAHNMCGRKMRYETEYEAMKRAEVSRCFGAPRLTAYKCPYCDGWHLTHKTQ